MTIVAEDLAQLMQSSMDAGLTTIKSLITPVCNVKGYSAKGDGVTNDTQYITDALNAATNKETVFMPPGVYLVDSITIPVGVKLIGSGIGITTIKANSVVNTIKLSEGASLENLTVDGNSKVNYSGVLIDNANDCKVINVESKNNGYHGIAITTGLRNVLQNCYTSGNGYRGVLIDPNSGYNRVINLYSYLDGLAGILIGHNSYRNHVIGGMIIQPGDAGVWVHNQAYGNILTGFTVISPAGTAPGVLLVANSYDNILSNFQVIDAFRGILIRGEDVLTGYVNGNTRNNIISDFYLEGNAATDSIGISFDQLAGSSYIPQNNKIFNGRINNFYDAIGDVVGVADANYFADIDTENITNFVFRMGTDYGNSRVHNIKGYTPFGSLASETAHPAVPATTVPVTNPFPFTCAVYISGIPVGGGVLINGTNTNSTQHDDGNGMHIVGPGQTIALTYPSGTPVWRWFGLM